MPVSHTHTTTLPSWTSCVMSNILWTDSTPWLGYQLDLKTGLLAPWEHYLSLPEHQLTSKSSPLSNSGEDGAWCSPGAKSLSDLCVISLHNYS